MTVWLPGMRCVCLADCLWSVADASVVIFDGPVKGGIYTVADVFHIETGELMLVFEEFCASDGFFSECFRPLSETRLDVFRKMLAPNPTDRVPA